MELPFVPMLAKLSEDLPEGPELLYEPKWDGMRCIAAKLPESIELWSRHERPLSRYFPELVEALRTVDGTFVVDGELILRREGELDFEALLLRLHPSQSRVRLLSERTPVTFVAFDLVELDGRDLISEPLEARRRALEQLMEKLPPGTELSPITADAAQAGKWLESQRFEGVVAKRRSLPYRPGVRAMVKVKKVRTADCVVGGFRWHRNEPAVGSLLLGVYEGDALIHVGLATSFTAARRVELTRELRPLISPLDGHPWEHGFPHQGGPVGRLPGAGSRWADEGGLNWVPVRPELVCEVGYDRLDGRSFRHPARFKRWRPDREPRSCTWEQFPGFVKLPA